MKKFIYRFIMSALLLLIPQHYLAAQANDEIVALYLQKISSINNNTNSNKGEKLKELIDSITVDVRDFAKSSLLLRAKINLLEYKLGNNSTSDITILDSLEQLVEGEVQASKSVGYAVLSQYAYNYALNNVAALVRRPMVSYNEKDKHTWTWKNFIEKAIFWQEKAVEGEAIKKEASANWDLFFDIKLAPIEGYNANIQSTLYDVFMSHLLKMYQIEYNYLSNAFQVSVLPVDKLFAPAERFIQTDFNFKDKSTVQAKTIRAFQQWLSFNNNKEKAFALVQADLYRLEYALSQTQDENKIQLYANAFNQLRAQHKNTLVGAYLDFKWIAYLKQYQPKDLTEENIDRIIEGIKANPQLDVNMKNDINKLSALLNQSSLSVNIEPIVSINKSSLVNVAYQYMDTLYYKVIRKNKEESIYAGGITRLQQQPAVVSKYWVTVGKKSRSLKTTEFLLEGLPAGRYYLLVSSNKDFTEQLTNSVYITDFLVSDMAFVVQNQNSAALEGLLLDRNTGKAIDLDKILVKYLNNYNTNELQALPFTIEDKMRLNINCSNITRYNYYTNSYDKIIYFINGEDTLRYQMNNNSFITSRRLNKSLTSSWEREAKSQTETYLFTDRAIYRPGQKIYVKGIVFSRIINRVDPTPKVLDKVDQYLEFRDNKNNTLKRILVTTNEFGSFDAELEIPTQAQTGSFYIYVGNFNTVVKVEEYKRHQFYIEQVQDKELYTLGDSVTINGKAMAYAGSALVGAKVRYTLKRDDGIIKDSTLATDNTGAFVITFQTKKDSTLSKNEKHTYSLRTDVVDITGETHTHTINLVIGAMSKEINIAMPEYVAKNEKIEAKILSRDFNGKPIASEGKIEIYQYLGTQKFYINRYWEMPNVTAISKNIFEQAVPQYAYELPKSLNKNLILSATFNTQQAPYYTLSANELKAGTYTMVLTSKDNNGEDIVTEKDFTVYQPKEAISNISLMIPQTVYTVEKNATLNIPVYAHKAANVLVEVQTEEGIAHTQFLKVHNYNTFVLPLKEVYTSVFKVHFTTLYCGRLYTKSVDVNVVLPTSELKIELLTFRDKMKGGEDETWKIKILGQQDKNISAELLATMYDASLDAFLSNSWILPALQNKPSLGTYQLLLANTPTTKYKHVGADFAPSTYTHRSLKYASWSNRYYYHNTYRYYALIFEDAGYLQYYFNNVTTQNYYASGSGQNGYNNNITLSNKEVASLPRNTIDLKAQRTGIVQGDATHTSGSRASSDDTYVDAVRVYGTKPIMETIEVESHRPVVAQADNFSPVLYSTELTKLPVEPSKEQNPIQVRNNLHETVFFFPRVQRNERGEYVLQFKMNDALTRWKFMLFAHDKNMNWTSQEHYVVTQKDLMIQPNAPRFLRQGDTILFPAKISNLTNAEMNGEAELQFFDAFTDEPLSHIFGKGNMVSSFYIKPQEVTVIQWRVVIPDNFHGVVKYKMIAKAGQHTDGEANVLPVLSNQTLVTKVMPIGIDSKGEKTFEFKEMKAIMANSNTMRNYQVALTLNASHLSNALTSLGFLKAYPHNCSEQLFSIYYANVTGNYLLKNNPAFKQLMSQDVGKKSLASADKLPASALKIVEAEAAWMLDNKSINKDLFNDEIVSTEIDNIMNLLTARQNADGGLSWYGGKSDVYISQLWAKGMGEFIDKGMVKAEGRNLKMLQEAIRYLDNVFVGNISSHNSREVFLDYNYLYTRSLYEKLIPVSQAVKSKREQLLAKPWGDLSISDRIKLAIVAHNLNKIDLRDKLIKDIKANIGNIDTFNSYVHYPYYVNTFEVYAQLIELLFKTDKKDVWIDNIKAYLIKNKQGNAWGSTKSTTQVLYALFFYSEENNTTTTHDLALQIGNEKLDKLELENLSKYGALNKIFDNVNSNFTELKIANNSSIQPLHGNVIWRYFENFDKISNEENATVKKTLLIRKDGDVFVPYNENNPIKVGDLVRVRLEINVKSAMGYVQVKDMRAAGFEPIDVFSIYKKSGNLSYYQAVSDAAMNFFIDNLSQGNYVLEYDLRATYPGHFNNGVTSVESMYAPDKTAYSKAVRLTIE